MAVETLPIVTPIVHDAPSRVDFGAKVTNVDLNTITPEQFKVVEDALYKYKVLVFPNQGGLTAANEYKFTHMFDPTAPFVRGHEDADGMYGNTKSLLAGIGNLTSEHPEIRLVGGGKQADGRVLPQADHVSYHRFPLTQAQRDEGFTRWHRWHMDAALFKTELPLVTALLAKAVPQGEQLTVRWDDASGATMKVAPGSTGFISGARMLSVLPAEKQQLVLNSKVQYAPYPYQWNANSKGNSNGLGTYNEGKELALEDLPEWDEKDVKIYPMAWTNPKTGEKTFQVHSVAVQKLHLRSSPDAEYEIVDDLAEVRRILYELQRPVLEPENVWAPPYAVGDLVLFYNRGVYHSATDYPQSLGTRSMLQAHVACTYPPS